MKDADQSLNYFKFENRTSLGAIYYRDDSPVFLLPYDFFVELMFEIKLSATRRVYFCT